MADAGSGNTQNAFKLHGNRIQSIHSDYLYFSTHLKAQAPIPQTCH